MCILTQYIFSIQFYGNSPVGHIYKHSQNVLDNIIDNIPTDTVRATNKDGGVGFGNWGTLPCAPPCWGLQRLSTCGG